ncbi:MAG: type II and III secretion system protein family protein [Gemmatimonadales bacterium]
MSYFRRAGLSALALLAALMAVGVGTAEAQRIVTQAERVVSVSKGGSALLVNPVPIARFSVGDPAIAEATVVSPTEVIINGKGLGTTTLFVWDGSAQVRVYSVEVTADAPGLERFLRSLMPDEEIRVAASGNAVTLSGTVKDPNSVSRAVQIAQASGATVIDNLVAPPAVQVLVKVRFAEINRTALKDWAARLRVLNPHEISHEGNWSGFTEPSGAVETIGFLLDSGNEEVEALVQAAVAKGDLRTLAEPNLLTLPGKEAYFLAGGEFPYPSIQGTGSNAVTITFKEFGIKLRFTPNIARNGAIRLKVEPEVSTLDFANGLTIAGFEIPSLRTRKAVTEVELREGQHLAVAGLLDNESTRNLTKIPILGDIPILGELFRSRSMRQRRTELVVIVTPSLVMATDSAPPVPTGEPGTMPEPESWKWEKHLRGSERAAPSNPLQPGNQ